MIKYIDCKKKNYLIEIKKIISFRPLANNKTQKLVKTIIMDVKKNGDRALLKYEKKFSDNNKIKTNKLKINQSIKSLDAKIKNAIDLSYKRIKKFHSKQKVKNIYYKDTQRNIFRYKYLPIESVGIYVPGGNASFPSTVLMNAIPARIAGVKRIVMVNPTKNGKQSPGVLYAAKKCGVNEIYSIGGAQSIGALTYGTKTVKKVDKIVGPGNTFVTSAKKEVFGEVGIDMIAGPSEITVVADDKGNSSWIASDLIAQAEHDINSQSILITKSERLIIDVKKEIKKQLVNLPRKEIAQKSLSSNGIFIKTTSEEQIVKLINLLGPEHLVINTKNYNKIIGQIKNAGSICLGKYSAMAITDYNAGTNHILPTNSSAKFSSGLSVYDFYKRISLINLSKKGIETIGEQAINLANYEGLVGHARSVETRIRRK